MTPSCFSYIRISDESPIRIAFPSIRILDPRVSVFLTQEIRILDPRVSVFLTQEIRILDPRNLPRTSILIDFPKNATSYDFVITTILRRRRNTRGIRRRYLNKFSKEPPVEKCPLPEKNKMLHLRCGERNLRGLKEKAVQIQTKTCFSITNF